MDLIAHRGCAGQHPENTVRAVRKSSRRFPAVELDVRRCRTGELVVFHDETVDRVTDGTGSVAAMDWDRLRSLEVLESGERNPPQ
jgi:glycerophosphoryl diester phosphodiesterase